MAVLCLVALGAARGELFDVDLSARGEHAVSRVMCKPRSEVLARPVGAWARGRLAPRPGSW